MRQKQKINRPTFISVYSTKKQKKRNFNTQVSIPKEKYIGDLIDKINNEKKSKETSNRLEQCTEILRVINTETRDRKCIILQGAQLTIIESLLEDDWTVEKKNQPKQSSETKKLKPRIKHDEMFEDDVDRKERTKHSVNNHKGLYNKSYG